MFKKTLLHPVDVKPTSISVEWTIDERIDLTHILLKYKRTDSKGSDAGTIEISPMAIGYDLMNLIPEKLYEIQVAPSDTKRRYSWSDLLVIQTLKNKKYEVYYPSEKVVKNIPLESKEIIDSRMLKGWDEYLKCGFKFARPREVRETVLKRTLNYVEALERLDYEFDVNDFMCQGPFVVMKK